MSKHSTGEVVRHLICVAGPVWTGLRFPSGWTPDHVDFWVWACSRLGAIYLEPIGVIWTLPEAWSMWQDHPELIAEIGSYVEDQTREFNVSLSEAAIEKRVVAQLLGRADSIQANPTPQQRYDDSVGDDGAWLHLATLTAAVQIFEHYFAIRPRELKLLEFGGVAYDTQCD